MRTAVSTVLLGVSAAPSCRAAGDILEDNTNNVSSPVLRFFFHEGEGRRPRSAERTRVIVKKICS